jgi:hypothetical protein
MTLQSTYFSSEYVGLVVFLLYQSKLKDYKGNIGDKVKLRQAL